MAKKIEDDNKAISEEYWVDEKMLDKNSIKQHFYRKEYNMDVKFDKKKFSNILIKIVDSYGSQREFCRITKISRTRISEYMNCKVNKPPKPGFIMRLAYYSQDIISYDELMTMCGYESPDVIIKNKRLRERNFIL